MRPGFDSIGFIDIGNDDMWEVFAPVSLPVENPDGFVHNNFPVYVASHGDIDRWVMLTDFLKHYAGGPHLNEIMMQIGHLLSKYVEESKPKESPYEKHPPSSLESSADAAAEWSIDAAIAERERDK